MYGPNDDPNAVEAADPPTEGDKDPPPYTTVTPADAPVVPPSPTNPATHANSNFRTRRLQALLDREGATGTEAQEAQKQLAEVARLKGELGTLHRLQLQLQLVKAENAQLRRLLNRGMEAVEREHDERRLEYDNIAKEKCDLEERLKEAVQEVECHQADVRLAFDEAHRVGLQNLHLLKVLDQKEAALEQLRGQLALSDHAHRRTLDMLDQSSKQNVGVGKLQLDAAQDCSRLKEKLTQSHARCWRLEQEKEAVQSELLSLRSVVSGLQRQVALQSAWQGVIPVDVPPTTPVIPGNEGAKSASPWQTSHLPSGSRNVLVSPLSSSVSRTQSAVRTQSGLPNLRKTTSVKHSPSPLPQKLGSSTASPRSNTAAKLPKVL